MTRLLLALLIIAVIAVTALWLFGRVLEGMDDHIDGRNP